MRTTLVARMQLVASQLQTEGTIRGLLRVYGLKIGAVPRNRFAAGVIDLLEEAALPELSAQSSPCRERAKLCAPNRKRRTAFRPAWPGALTSAGA
jgi:hypothetical protein